MPAHQGYLCLIQYCPDRARMEAVNVGLVVFCPALDLLEVRVTERDDRAARLFGADRVRLDLLDHGKRAVVNRLRGADSRPRTLEELQHFVDTRGNDVILTPPRSMRVEEPARQLDELFRQLVLDPPAARVAPVPPNGANGASAAEPVRSEPTSTAFPD
jgi:hypothetical protein